MALILNVDIQPEYSKNISFMREWVRYVNGNSNIFLYNGESLGMIDWGDYAAWLLDWGVKESVLDRSKFFDKGYAFLRNWMDSDMPVDDLKRVIKFMYQNKIYDSRDLSDEDYKFLEIDAEANYIKNDCIFIPDVMPYLDDIRDTMTVVGGGCNECLLEIVLCLEALNKKYEINKKFVY